MRVVSWMGRMVYCSTVFMNCRSTNQFRFFPISERNLLAPKLVFPIWSVGFDIVERSSPFTEIDCDPYSTSSSVSVCPTIHKRMSYRKLGTIQFYL